MSNIISMFRESEKTLNVQFASQFYEFLEEFLKLTRIAEFELLFKMSHFCTAIEMRYVIDNLLPNSFLPFFVEENYGRKDFYCFNRSNPEDANRIIVISEDAVVSEWQNYKLFNEWLKGKINTLKSNTHDPI